jgi:hypothetical protein
VVYYILKDLHLCAEAVGLGLGYLSLLEFWDGLLGCGKIQMTLTISVGEGGIIAALGLA